MKCHNQEYLAQRRIRAVVRAWLLCDGQPLQITHPLSEINYHCEDGGCAFAIDITDPAVALCIY